MADPLVCDGCGDKIEGEPFSKLRGRIVCSARCAGRALAEIAAEKRAAGEVPERKGKTQRQLRNKSHAETRALFIAHGLPIPPEYELRGTKGHKRLVVEPKPVPLPFFLAPDDRAVPAKMHGWSQVEFDKRTYHVEAVTLLVKVTEDTQWRVFGNMINVMAYTDPELGLLLRPNMGGVQGTFDDLPAALKVAKKAIYKRVKKEEVDEEEKETKTKASKDEATVRYKPAEGASYGNISSDPHTKRYWLIESMLQGGTAREIVKRADKLATEAGYYEKGVIWDSMAKNPANIRKFYKEVRAKQQKLGIQSRITEQDDTWSVEIIKP